MPRAPASRARLRRALANPWASLILFVMLAGSLAALPLWSYEQSSTAARLRDRLEGRLYSGPNWNIFETNVLVRRAPQGLTAVLPDDESWGDLLSAAKAWPQDYLMVTLQRVESDSGFWALTTRRRDITLGAYWTPDPAAWTTADLVEARRFAAMHLQSVENVTPTEAAALIQGDIHERQILWLGWLHNAVTLLACAGLLYSLLWVPARWNTLLLQRRARAMADGVCPSCNYPLTGLRAPVCPECGKALTDPHTPQSG